MQLEINMPAADAIIQSVAPIAAMLDAQLSAMAIARASFSTSGKAGRVALPGAFSIEGSCLSPVGCTSLASLLGGEPVFKLGPDSKVYIHVGTLTLLPRVFLLVAKQGG